MATLDRLRVQTGAARGDHAASGARSSVGAPWVVDVVVLALAAALLRVPALLASRHLLFDDGVYGASAVAMRHGALPFREVFSSQGPLFLPLVFVFDLLGGRTLDAPRLLALVSGVGVTLAVYAIGRELTSRGGALLAAGLVACSGSVLWTTGPLTSDGPGVALSCFTVLLACRYARRSSTGSAVAIGACAGAAFAVKSLLVVPALVAAALLLVSRRRLVDVAVAGAAAVVVVVAVTVPWGVHNVIEQSVGYHTDQATHQTPWANTVKTFSTLGDRDAPIFGALVLAVAFTAFAAVRSRSRRRRDGTSALGRFVAHTPTNRPNAGGGGEPGQVWRVIGNPRVAVAVWALLAFVVLVLESPMWRNHLAHLVPALALLVGAYRPPWVALAAAALVLVPYHVVHVHDVLAPAPYRGSDAVLEHALRALPPRAQAISDDPGFVWRSGHRTPPDFVDTSVLRIESTRPGIHITGATVAAAARRPAVCAVVIWSSRFGRFSDLPSRLQRAGYQQQLTFPHHRSLWTRPCPR